MPTPSMMKPTQKKALLALCLLVPAPTIGVVMSMIVPATRGTALGQGIYAVSKMWLLALPLIWLIWVDRQKISFSPLKKGGMTMGLISGIVVALTIYGAWFFFGQALIDPQNLKEQVAANGIGSPARYLLLAAYLTLINALLEEYVWRWFVFKKFEALTGGAFAVLGSALCFTLHHVVALKAQMGWGVTILGSAGVCVGGLIWSWLYHRYRSIWPGYLSHLLADAAIFVAGWQILFAG